MKKSGKEVKTFGNEKTYFYRVLLVAIIIIFINSGLIFYKYGDLEKPLTGFSIKETASNAGQNTHPILKMSLIGQCACLVLALFLTRPKRAQSAMEFLMTYGWAIMAAVMALGVLAYFGVFTPGKYVSGSAIVAPPFYINAWDIQETGITLEIKNNGGERYRIRSVDIENCGINNNLVIISTSGLETMIVPCDLSNYTTFKGDITITYRKLSNSSVDLKSVGTIAGRVGRGGTANCTYGPWIDRECELGSCLMGEMYQNQSILSGTGCAEVSRCIVNDTCCTYNPWIDYECGLDDCAEGEIYQNRTMINGTDCTYLYRCNENETCCDYEDWVDQGCGLGNCTAGEMYQNRSVANGSAICTITENCNPDPTCGGGGIPISTCAQLQNMSEDLYGDYFLTKNIDCSDTINWNNGSGFKPINNATTNIFRGTFDGQGYIISDLYINRPLENYIGLFKASGVTVPLLRNIGLTNVNITGWSEVGALIGSNGGIVENSYSTGTVTGAGFITNAGGLIGVNNNAASWISNSYSTADVSGNMNVGGLTSFLAGGLSKSYASGDIVCTMGCGGLVGGISGAYIGNSFSTGSVSTGGGNTGGLIGSIITPSIISNNYWNNHTGNPDICIGSGEIVACTPIPDNEPYFYDIENSPITNWSFPPWSPINDDIDLPILE